MSLGEYPVALLAGLVSFLAPCVLPLVPGYLSAVSAVSAEELGRPGMARRVVVASIPFVVGFSAPIAISFDALIVTKYVLWKSHPVTVRPFSTDGGLPQDANQTTFGLASGVWTSDLSKAHRTASRQPGRRVPLVLPGGCWCPRTPS